MISPVAREQAILRFIPTVQRSESRMYVISRWDGKRSAMVSVPSSTMINSLLGYSCRSKYLSACGINSRRLYVGIMQEIFGVIHLPPRHNPLEGSWSEHVSL